MYFTCEMEHSHMKINFTCEIFVSHVELKQFTYEIFFNVKLHVKFLYGLIQNSQVSVPCFVN